MTGSPVQLPDLVRRLFAIGVRRRSAVRQEEIAEATSLLQADGRFRFLVRIDPAADDKRRWDAFEILSPDGRVLGARAVPEERSGDRPVLHELADVFVPAGIAYVFVRFRRVARGYDGQTFKIVLPAARVTDAPAEGARGV
jgi:hypothetical protein